MIISTKLFLILIAVFRRFLVFVIVISHGPWGHVFFMDQISFSCFCRGSPKEHSCEVWLKLAKFYRSCHFKPIVALHIDDNGQQTLTDSNRLLWVQSAHVS